MYHCRNSLLAKIVLSETIFSFLYYNLDEVFFFFFFFFFFFLMQLQANLSNKCKNRVPIKASMIYMSLEDMKAVANTRKMLKYQN